MSISTATILNRQFRSKDIYYTVADRAHRLAATITCCRCVYKRVRLTGRVITPRASTARGNVAITRRHWLRRSNNGPWRLQWCREFVSRAVGKRSTPSRRAYWRSLMYARWRREAAGRDYVLTPTPPPLLSPLAVRSTGVQSRLARKSLIAGRGVRETSCKDQSVASHVILAAFRRQTFVWSTVTESARHARTTSYFSSFNAVIRCTSVCVVFVVPVHAVRLISNFTCSNCCKSATNLCDKSNAVYQIHNIEHTLLQVLLKIAQCDSYS